MPESTVQPINGINTHALGEFAESVKNDPANGKVDFKVATDWKCGTLSETRVESWSLGGQEIAKDYTIEIDEPVELLGGNKAPNPQEYLMAAFNACISVGYVAGASIRGIELESLQIETEGTLDLRGFLGLDPDVIPGYDEVRFTVKIKGNGTPEQFQEIHEAVMKTSPNAFNIREKVNLVPTLEVDCV